MKKHLMTLLKIIFSTGIVFWLISSGKINLSSLGLLFSIKPLIICLALVFVGFLLNNQRWRELLRTQNINTTFVSTMKLTMIGVFFNFAMPGGVGGDIIKGYYFVRDNPSAKTAAATSVIFDRIVGLFAMILMAFLAVSFEILTNRPSSILINIFKLISLLLISVILAFVIIFSKKIYNKKIVIKLLDKLPLKIKTIHLYETCHLYGKNKKHLFLGIIYSFMSQGFSIYLLYFCGTIISPDFADLTTYFVVAPIAFMATAIPISPAGVGVGQAAFYYLFKQISQIDSELGATSITALQAFQFLVGLLGAIFYLQRKDKIDEKLLTATQDSE